MDEQGVAAALADLGMDRQSRMALLLLPLVRVAWADGKVQDKEKAVILRFADTVAGLGEEGAYLLADWLRYAPSPGYFSRGQALLRALLERRAPDLDEATVKAAVAAAREVAKASGGLFGFLRSTADEDRALAEIEAALKAPAPAPAAPDPKWASRMTMMGTDEDDGDDAPALVGVVVVEDAQGRHKLVVGEGGLVVGSGPEAQLRLPGVAPVHCRFVERRRRYYVEDQASAGTFVNGERIGARRLLGGETVKVGAHALVFKMGRRG